MRSRARNPQLDTQPKATPDGCRDVQRLDQSAGFDVLHAAQKDFTKAVDLFKTYEGLSFGDATIVEYMKHERIKHLYSFNDDFDAVQGITRFAM